LAWSPGVGGRLKVKLRAIDLYSGVGGWFLGLRLAGIDVVGSYDLSGPANETNFKNNRHQAQSVHIRRLSFEDLPGDIAGAMAIGFVALFSAPFKVPMLIEADPSRSAAAQSGGVGLLGGAIGPFLASRVIAGHGVEAVLALGAVMLIAALLILSTLHLTRVRPAAAAIAR
jgi:hypothetical protein